MPKHELTSTEGWTCCAATTVGNDDPHAQAEAAVERYARDGHEYGYRLQEREESGVFRITAVLYKRDR